MKYCMRLIFLLIPLVIFLLVDPALAGEAGTVSCTTPGCGYHTNLKIGGGKRTPAVTGYCPKEKKFVRVKLKSHDDYRKPQKCPDCQTQLQPIYDRSEISKIPCPQCGNPSLNYEIKLRFD
jgi:hypothetical protein